VPRTRPALTGALLPTVLVAVVVVGAATGGPWRVSLHVPAGPTWHVYVRPPQPPPVPQHPLTARTPHPYSGEAAHILGIVLLVLAALLALGILALVAWRLRGLIRLPQRQPRFEEPDRLPGVPLDPSRMATGLEQAEKAAARPGRPRDAVVAAWLALEDAAALSGVSRDPAKTPTEFVVDVLDRTGADPRATRRLLAVYLHARFSTDPVTAEQVATAQQCLAELRSGIQVSLA
jgi:hypothetical protein